MLSIVGNISEIKVVDDLNKKVRDILPLQSLGVTGDNKSQQTLNIQI